jgi:Holliday junction resolvase RusA-like endonuclease
MRSILMSGKKTPKRVQLPCSLRIELKPVPAARARIPRYGKPYYPKTYKAWINSAEKLVEQVTGALEIPIRAESLFAIPRARTSQLIVPVGDGDNFEKAVFDLIQKKGFLMDDKWIVTGLWRKRWLPVGAQGYTLITLREETDELTIEG